MCRLSRGGGGDVKLGIGTEPNVLQLRNGADDETARCAVESNDKEDHLVGSGRGVRLYFDHLNNYERAYGHLNTVVMLLLWLDVTNGAILIGGEMNSEIESEADQRQRAGR